MNFAGLQSQAACIRLRLATADTSVIASTGFATCSWKPAAKAARRSSSRANAVSAAAGIEATRGARQGSHLPDQVVPVLVRHPYISKENVDFSALQQLERLRGRRCGQDQGV